MKEPKRSNDLANSAIPSDPKAKPPTVAGKLDRLNEQQERLDKITQQSAFARSVNEQMERMERLTKSNPMMQKLNEQMQAMEKLTKISPAAQSILDQVNEQRRRLETISRPSSGKRIDQKLPEQVATPLRIPNIPDFRNPILDTNEKLSDIEQKFDSMLNVMANAAQIGNEIQAQAVTFIAKFEEASDKTDKAAKQAIKVGVLAVVISVVGLLSPPIQNTFWPDETVPAIKALTKEIIVSRDLVASDNQKLFEALRNENEDTVDRVLTEFRQKQEETNAILREMIDVIKKSSVTATP